MSFIGKVFIMDDYFNDKARNNVDFENVEVIEDILYDKTDDEEMQADLYLNSEAEKPCPVVIYVHGGGWIVGDKKFRRGFAKTIASHKIAVFNINYALSPRHKYPACIKNVFKAIDWIYKNSEKYNLDINNIFLSGESAGAHIAAVCGATLRAEEFKKKIGVNKCYSKIKGLLLYCGAYNVDTMVKRPFAAGTFRDMSGLDLSEIKSYEYYKELSPVNYIDKNFPPTFLVSSKHDIFCYGQDKEIIEKFNQFKIPYHWFYAKTMFNSVHCFQLSLKTNNSKRCIEKSVKFIKAIVSGGKKI